MAGSTRYRINTPAVTYETIDGEVVIVDLASGSYYSLQHAGVDVWALVEAGATMEEMQQRLGRAYHGAEAEIGEAVAALIAQLRQESLIVPRDAERAAEERLDVATAADAGPGALPPGTGEPLQIREFHPPVLSKYTDMQELLLLDPIHEVDQAGWPMKAPEDR